MSSTVSQLHALYQYLDKLFTQSAALAANGRLQPALEQLATKFCQLYQQQPALMHAQLSLLMPQYRQQTQLAVRQQVLVLALTRHWPLPLQEQLCSAALGALCGLSEQQITERQAEPLADPWLLTLRQLKTQLPSVWLSLFASCFRFRQALPCWQLDPLAAVLVVSYQLSVALHLSKNGFEHCFRQHWLRRQQHDQTLLLRLGELGPGLYQTGRFCSDSIGALAFICEAEPQLQGYLFDLNLRSLNAEPVSLQGAGMQLLPPKPLHDQSWLGLLTRKAQDELKTADPEPVSLPLIQQLNPDWSISKQISFLQQHPAFCQLLQQEASQLSRQQLQVTDLRHALALIGTEQLPALLRLSWLRQQILLCCQPWQAWFDGLVASFASSLQLLAQSTSKVALSSQQAQLIATSLSLQLQQHDELRHLPLHSISRQQPSLPAQCRRLLWQDPALPAHLAQTLAAAGLGVIWQDAVLQWRQPAEMQNEYSQQQSANLLLQFAWLCTEICYLGGASLPEQAGPLVKKAQHALDLPAVSLSYWLDLLLQHHHASWPLQPAL